MAHIQTKVPLTGFLGDSNGKSTILPTRTLRPNEFHLSQAARATDHPKAPGASGANKSLENWVP